ncbi:RNA ligase 2 [Thecamonas trahens ATCC 50062]|uniref:RNA ligase 2 n=1 Tax=Thecamonas trahens ATCC 50062 TaxID=461836 RepID=A0A0L0D5H5_THETB|nr:RNA ligase 2 [Thecamonas trahens ATCC 50062]KNC47341.1 RNA ligase 2 [Thecamonas trahens ATCC 50062]|eukprot:XP_013759679.1 RNA ligase 2 [Thecamonas trahens ATCC 50062]
MEGMVEAVAAAFVPYPKIPTAFSGSADDARRVRTIEWVATEKIHGANLTLMCDGQVVVPAKRRGVLADDEDFFGLRSSGLLASLARPAIELAQALGAGSGTSIAVSGELFGADVQPGIDYGPQLQFAVFDVALLAADGDRRFLAHDEMTAVATAAGFTVVHEVARGSYTKLLDTPIGFDSHWPALLGLEPLPPAGANTAEGIVLRPATTDDRFLVKIKDPSFADVEASGRAHKSMMVAADGSSSAAADAQNIFYELQLYLTPARAQSARDW